MKAIALKLALVVVIVIVGALLIADVLALGGCTLVLVTGDHDNVRDIEGADSDLTSSSRPLVREQNNADQYLQRLRQPDPGHR
ncbi:hypothetical protein HDG32_005529 [Paraburkholderia sp. CI2]|uniref:hypothetical protein n=1 Tax=Paraburkholderia sp. CI2 TaxID=2723093 RepID=UPI00161B1381|nr:hypothetical protein [Paraburkholderia sp. CI2]MBB5469382.1 hypothetical protein [Paraburkholderia sp. CI2]